MLHSNIYPSIAATPASAPVHNWNQAFADRKIEIQGGRPGTSRHSQIDQEVAGLIQGSLVPLLAASKSPSGRAAAQVFTDKTNLDQIKVFVSALKDRYAYLRNHPLFQHEFAQSSPTKAPGVASKQPVGKLEALPRFIAASSKASKAETVQGLRDHALDNLFVMYHQVHIDGSTRLNSTIIDQGMVTMWMDQILAVMMAPEDSPLRRMLAFSDLGNTMVYPSPLAAKGRAAAAAATVYPNLNSHRLPTKQQQQQHLAYNDERKDQHSDEWTDLDQLTPPRFTPQSAGDTAQFNNTAANLRYNRMMQDEADRAHQQRMEDQRALAEEHRIAAKQYQQQQQQIEKQRLADQQKRVADQEIAAEHQRLIVKQQQQEYAAIERQRLADQEQRALDQRLAMEQKMEQQRKLEQQQQQRQQQEQQQREQQEQQQREQQEQQHREQQEQQHREQQEQQHREQQEQRQRMAVAAEQRNQQRIAAAAAATAAAAAVIARATEEQPGSDHIPLVQGNVFQQAASAAVKVSAATKVVPNDYVMVNEMVKRQSSVTIKSFYESATDHKVRRCRAITNAGTVCQRNHMPQLGGLCSQHHTALVNACK